MKRIQLTYLAFLLAFLSCEPAKTTVSITPTVLELKVGETSTLTAKTTPEVAVEWSTSNPEVVSVFHGTLTAEGIGQATVTATADGTTASCQVFVLNAAGDMLSIVPSMTIEVEQGATFQYDYVNVYGTSLTWSSSNTDVATVDENGLVTALNGGYTTITLSNGVEETTTLFVVKRTWGEYALVWSDEFDDDALNTDNWTIEVNANGGGNNEKQYYTDRPENIRVVDGCLEIEVKKETYTAAGQTRDYTSGRLNTQGKQTFKYGKIEARIALPGGGGTWPAFWTLGADFNTPGVGWPKCGEIDIMEHVGNRPDHVTCALHTAAKNGTIGNNWHGGVDAPGVVGEFHVFGIEWVEEGLEGRDQIIFTLDGVPYATATEEHSNMDNNQYWPYNKEHFIILNVAIGGNMGGTIDPNFTSKTMKVDWVRVYQREE